MYEFVVFHVQKFFFELIYKNKNSATKPILSLVDGVIYLAILFHNFFSFVKRQGHVCCLCYGNGQAE